MDTPKDTPSDLAKQTLTRLARERLMPSPVNYCSTYRKLEGSHEAWASYCHYTKLLEEALAELVVGWQESGPVVDQETAKIARDFSQLVFSSTTEDDLKRVREIGNVLGIRMKRDLATGSSLHVELIGIAQLALANLGSHAEEDHWLRNQFESLEELLAGQVSSGSLVKAKHVLGTALDRQRKLQASMTESRQVLKFVMAELIRQAASLVADTSGYELKITELGEHIQAADDLASIKSVVQELDVFVQDMGQSVRQSHDSMASSHTRLLQAEQQIADLRKNLAETSEKVRRDSLTGALNRSGLDEIWRREVDRAKTDGASLSIGILDVDNFKLLNDQLGHTVGDEALVHLTAVIRTALHGTDTMARYGGEEFVILLPDTGIKGAEAVMQRLQRELTKHFFMHGNDRLLITFSAGVTSVDLEKDSLISAIERADTALYEAKRLGKNRVVAV